MSIPIDNPTRNLAGAGGSGGPGGPGGPPINDDFSKLIKSLQNSTSTGVSALGGLADSYSKTGPLTETKKGLLLITAELQLSNPTLSPVDKDLLGKFITAINSMPYSPSGPSLPAGNAWLDIKAFVTVISMIFEITSELSAIKLTEAQLQILMTKVNAAMADDIANCIVAAGKYEAEMHTNEAMAAYTQAGMAMASMVMISLTSLARSVKIGAAVQEWKVNHGNTGPDLEQMGNIERNVDASLTVARGISEQLPNMVNALSTANKEMLNKELTILKSETESASQKLSKLADLLKGSIDALRGDESEQSQTIAKLLDNFLSSFSRSRLGAQSS
jgi:hypothetical protein